MESIDLAQDIQVSGSCECGLEPEGSTTFWKYLDYLRTCWLVKKDSAGSSELRSYIDCSAAVFTTTTRTLNHIRG
jgi:hypothetical protein